MNITLGIYTGTHRVIDSLLHRINPSYTSPRRLKEIRAAQKDFDANVNSFVNEICQIKGISEDKKSDLLDAVIRNFRHLMRKNITPHLIKGDDLSNYEFVNYFVEKSYEKYSSIFDKETIDRFYQDRFKRLLQHYVQEGYLSETYLDIMIGDVIKTK